MSTNFILFPILTHMITAVVLIFFWQRIQAQRIISIIGNSIALILSLRLFVMVWNGGFLTLHSGGWKPPFGITFIADTLSVTLISLTSIVSLAIGIFSTIGVSINRIKYGFFPIFHFLIMGLIGAFLTGDIFNLYVWFEIVIISSFVMMTLGGKKPQMEGAIKYVAMNMLASVIFLTAIGILYGITGSLNMADLSIKVAQIENRGLVNVTSMLFFVAFGIKSAVFPLYFWLPSSYHTPPSATAAIFGGLLTKLGVYALLRMFTLIFVPDNFTLTLFIITAILTMLTGAFGAVNKSSIRRMWSYLIVCHIGYMLAGLGLHSQIALAGVIFYLMHDILIKSNIFLAGGIIYKITGSTDMRRLGGLYKHFPGFSLLFALIIFSLSGVPPLSGFWPKIYLIQESFSTGNYVLMFVIILASFITLALMVKMWAEIFWKESPKPLESVENSFAELPMLKKVFLIFPIIMLLTVSLFIGFKAEMFFQIANRIAAEMLDKSGYIQAVLGK